MGSNGLLTRWSGSFVRCTQMCLIAFYYRLHLVFYGIGIARTGGIRRGVMLELVEGREHSKTKSSVLGSSNLFKR